MAGTNEKLVLREGSDWMELQRVDPEGWLWLVTGGTLAAVGDVVQVPGLDRPDASSDSDAALTVSPFETEIVVDTLTRAVLLPCPSMGVRTLLQTLELAGLNAQAQIVRERVGWTPRFKGFRRRAA